MQGQAGGKRRHSDERPGTPAPPPIRQQRAHERPHASERGEENVSPMEQRARPSRPCPRTGSAASNGGRNVDLECPHRLSPNARNNARR